MIVIQKIAAFIANILKFHKLKILVVIVSALIIGVLIFPYDDLSDLVTSKVAQGSQNQVYLQFKHLGIDLFPAVGLSMQDVEIDTPLADGIKAGELSISPSIPSLILFKLGMTARLDRFLSGNLKFSFSSENSLNQVDGSGHYDISGEDINLADITKMFKLKYPLRGQLSLDLNGDIDAQFKRPIEAEFDLEGQKVQLLPMTLELPMPGTPPGTPPMEMNIPGISMSEIIAKGRMVPKEGPKGGVGLQQELVFDDVILGRASDPLSGKVRGTLGLQIGQDRGRMQAYIVSSDLRIQLAATPASQSDFGTYLGFLDSYKVPSKSGSLYQFRLASTRPGENPQITKLSEFR